MAERIDGKQAAEEVIRTVKAETRKLIEKTGVTPGLAVVILGDDAGSHVYVASKSRMAGECGFLSVKHELPAETREAELAALVEKLNGDPAIHGVLVQLPLPQHIDARRIIELIAPEKDVDGFGFANIGKLRTGEFGAAFAPCTPAGCMLLIRRIRGADLSGLRAVVIGRSNIVGKPMANLLLASDCTVTIAHSKTRDLAAVTRQADILVAAAGRPQLVRGDWIKPGATVIDVGINRIAAPERGEGKTRLVGDVDFAAAEAVAGAITPVPGGVGPMTIAMLMANTLTSACRIAGAAAPAF